LKVSTDQIWQWLKEVSDPEIPVLTVVDMGVVRDVELEEENLTISITPTYSGCPAMNEIEENIKKTLHGKGLENVKVKTLISPPWTTDWMTDEGKERLREFGIAPPEGGSKDKSTLFAEPKKVTCPHCRSTETEMISQFGSTACKSMYKCEDCLEPFDYFKCI
jgi:ring-1,2-phenylacetyl-CoA epoxidase subunit PaaD